MGGAGFTARTVVQPIDATALVGIEPASVRMFRVDVRRDSFIPVWSSGFNAGLEFVWATIEHPGTYVPIGLPRDRVLRDLLRELATQRRYTPTTNREEAQALTERVFSSFFEASGEAIEDLRTMLAEADAIVDPDPLALAAVPRTPRGGVLPGPLPRNLTVEELVGRMRSLATPPFGLPEEMLFFPPDESVSAPIVGDDAVLSGVAPDGRARMRVVDVLRGGTAEARGVRAAPPTPSPDWWMYHGDEEHSGIAHGSRINRTNVGQLRLRARISLAGPVVSVPAVVAGKIYVGLGNSLLAAGGSGGTLHKLDLRSGRIERTFTFNTPPFQGARQGLAGIACTPAVVGGRVYFSGLDGRIYCLDAETLAPRWVTNVRRADPSHNQPVTHFVNAEGWSSPLVVDDRVYVGVGEGESNAFGFVYCLDADSGDVIWLFATNVFEHGQDNEPNVVPASAIGVHPLPSTFAAAPDPPQRGAHPWSSCAFDRVSNRIFVGTGTGFPHAPLPQPRYTLGVLSLDATTGGAVRFFQPDPADTYRRDDTDMDMPPGPTVFSRGDRRVVATGGKLGSFFMFDPETLDVLPNGRRQLLPKAGGNGGFPGDTGQLLPNVDPHPLLPNGQRRTENFYGIFGSAAVHYGLQRLFVGVGGFASGVGTPGIDFTTTAFLRALNWGDLSDAWVTAVGPDRVRRYVVPRPPMYTSPGEAGFSSPAVVNDVVFLATSRPALYAFDAESGLPLWSAPGFGLPITNSFTLGPAIYGDHVIVGSANLGVLIYSL
jgi:outer membrane protein assembly factor BamB